MKSSLSGMWAPKLIGVGSQGIREASERWKVSKALSWSWEAKGERDWSNHWKKMWDQERLLLKKE